MDLARVVHDEAVALERAGAKYIQIDEPAISTRPDEMEIASRALGIVTEGVKAYTFTHICYGEFDKVYDQVANLPVDNLDLEMANSNYALFREFKEHPTDKGLSMGVSDVHSHVVESVEEMKEGIRRGLEVFPAERLFIDPDCGLKTRMEDEAVGKLRNIVTAVREVKAELGIE